MVAVMATRIADERYARASLRGRTHGSGNRNGQPAFIARPGRAAPPLATVRRLPRTAAARVAPVTRCHAPSLGAVWQLVQCVGVTRVSSFFFQAEDGIRARDVTGVQTCALPI